MANNVEFINKQISAYSTDIKHMESVISRTLDSSEEQKLRSEVARFKTEVANYQKMLSQIA